MAPRFIQLWRSVALSNFTDGSLKIFLPFVALTLAVSPSEVAYVFTFLTLGWPLFGLLAGVLTDRLLMASLPFWCHMIRAALFAALAVVALTGDIALWHLYLAAFVFSFFDVVFEVSLPRLVLETTTEGNRVQSNTRLAVTHTVTSEFLGPVLGSALSLYDPVLGLSILAAFYTISGVVLSALVRSSGSARPTGEADRRGGSSLLAAIREPVFWLLRHRTLFPLAIVGFGTSLAWGAWLSLEPFYLIETDPRTLTKVQFGFMMSILACGAVFAALVFERIRINKNRLTLLFIDAAGVIGVLAVSAMTKNPYLVGLALFLTGIGATIWSSIVITLRQEIVPRHLLGGVNGFFRVIVYGGFPAGSAIAGTLAEQIPIPTVFLTVALLSAVMASAILLADRSHRKSLEAV